ncbi:MAG TPA: hypothetical protein VKQ34_02605 [Candidatus Saccharimonadales bacterium]|nr:hypothetical protein [Candidatus Saccharimonadales bacterium]
MRKASFLDLFSNWRPLAAIGGALVAGGALLWVRLAGPTGGYSANELATLQQSHSFLYIFHHPVNAPFTLAVRLLQFAPGHHQLLAVRFAATLFGIACLAAFFLLVRTWHGLRTALFGTALFAASPWFLHTARLGTPEVLLFGVFILTSCGVWLKRTANPLVLLLCFVLATALLYVPGMVWIILAGVLWQWENIDRVFKKQLWAVSLGGLVFLAALVPLGLGIYHSPALAKTMAGLPAAGWPQVWGVLHNLASVPLAIVVHAPFNPEHWLGRLGLFDAFTLAMLGLGGYLYARHFGLLRTKLFVVILCIGTVLIGLGNSVTLTVLVPFLYILVAAGTGFLLDRWFVVFPRNMIAQSIGIGMVSIAVVASIVYGLMHYFTAWPGSPDTKAVFTVPASVTIEKK